MQLDTPHHVLISLELFPVIPEEALAYFGSDPENLFSMFFLTYFGSFSDEDAYEMLATLLYEVREHIESVEDIPEESLNKEQERFIHLEERVVNAYFQFSSNMYRMFYWLKALQDEIALDDVEVKQFDSNTALVTLHPTQGPDYHPLAADRVVLPNQDFVQRAKEKLRNIALERRQTYVPIPQI